MISAWFAGGLTGFWVICGWLGWFLGGLEGLWVVSSFTANDFKNY